MHTSLWFAVAMQVEFASDFSVTYYGTFKVGMGVLSFNIGGYTVGNVIMVTEDYADILDVRMPSPHP